jgi:hypothetical protein
LKQALAESHAESDAQAASRLSELQLTERLNSSDLAELIGTLHGEKSTRALIVLADMAAFLDPAPAEKLLNPLPTRTASDRLWRRLWTM